MTTSPHKHGRRSLSVFSLPHFRPFSKVGRNTAQNKAPDTSLRSASSLSCNPYRQIPASPEPTAAVSNVMVNGLIHPPATRNPSRMASTRVVTEIASNEHQSRQRPRSWFSFPRTSLRKHPARSLSIQLPKDSSSSTVTRSIISAPVLIGTTNMEVAEAEGVCCRDIVDAGLTASNAISAPILTSTTNKKVARAEGVSDQDIIDNILGRPLKDVTNNSNNRKVSKRGLFRAVSTRKVEQEQDKRPVADKSLLFNSEQNSERTARFSIIERGIARRRAETVNLCREKINKLTGHGRIKRKSIVKDNRATSHADDVAVDDVDDITTKPQPSIPNAGEGPFLSLNHSNSDFVLESLTKSFANVVDKLDHHSSSSAGENMAFVRSKSSIFNLKRRNKPADSVNTDKENGGQQGTDKAAQSNDDADEDANRTKINLAAIQALKQAQAQAQASRPSKNGSPPPSLQFSGAANGYVEAQPDPKYPKGVKVLSMHSNVMDFATPPSRITDLPKPPTDVKGKGKAPAGIWKENDGDDEVVLEDAPIYSPSLGNLSQYARPTPPPAQPAINADPNVVPETPTRQQAEKGYMRRLGIRKSKSGMGLLGIFNRTQKESAPLQARDTNQKTEKEQLLKKSRSMNLSALLKKGESHPNSEQGSKAPMPPPVPDITISPPRYGSQIQGSPISPSTPDGVQKRIQPRGSVTPADRAKRMGVVGMPHDDVNTPTITE